MSETYLRIWSWRDAPTEYKALSQHGGDEDWVLFASATCVGKWWPLMLEDAINGNEDSYSHGFGHVDRHVLSDGAVVVIFAHA